MNEHQTYRTMLAGSNVVCTSDDEAVLVGGIVGSAVTTGHFEPRAAAAAAQGLGRDWGLPGWPRLIGVAELGSVVARFRCEYARQGP